MDRALTSHFTAKAKTQGGIEAKVQPGGPAARAISATLVSAGHLRVGMLNFRGQPLAAGLREIAWLQFRVEAAGSKHVAAALRDALPVWQRPIHVAAALRDALPVWESARTHPEPEPVVTHGLQMAASIVVLMAVVSWGIWLFADILLKVAYSPTSS